MAPEPLTESLLRGEPRAIARAMSLVEDGTAEGDALMERIHARTGHAYLVGITGPPGAGKSTLTDRLIASIRREGATVGVIAVDPTSPFTGGAILGDRVRMGAHAGDEGVFIRSVATRGHLGGLARATADLAAVLDAAGKDVIVIETVGVGQDEVDIVRTADVSIVLLVPGAGDEVQTIKAGLMEIGDIYVVNKADRDGADAVARAVSAMLSMQSFAPGAWHPPVVRTEAHTGRGIEALWDAIRRFRERPDATRGGRGRARHAAHVRTVLVQEFLKRVEAAMPADRFDALAGRIAARDIGARAAAMEIMARVAGPPRARELPPPVLAVGTMPWGDLRLTFLHDGPFRLDGGAMFGVVPRVLWERHAPADDRHRIQLAMRPLLVEGPWGRLLIDCGAGDKMDAKASDIYGFDRSRALDAALGEAGLAAADIDLVLATHLHFDHFGGATARRDGRLAPRFPGARYVIRRGEWEDATHPHERNRASYLPDDFVPLAEAGVVSFHDDDGEIAPGVRVVRTGGHTGQHQIVFVESAGQTAVFTADLIPTTAHVQDAWVMGYDLFPVETLMFKKRFIREAIAHEYLIVFEHDPVVAAGYIREQAGRRTVERVV